MSDDEEKPPIDCRIRPTEWTNHDEYQYLNKRIDSFLSSLANLDRKYNAVFLSYERKFQKIFQSCIIMTLLFLMILLLVIFGDLFK